MYEMPYLRYYSTMNNGNGNDLLFKLSVLTAIKCRPYLGQVMDTMPKESIIFHWPPSSIMVLKSTLMIHQALRVILLCENLQQNNDYHVKEVCRKQLNEYDFCSGLSYQQKWRFEFDIYFKRHLLTKKNGHCSWMLAKTIITDISKRSSDFDPMHGGNALTSRANVFVFVFCVRKRLQRTVPPV